MKTITAGELRAMGFSIESHIPDVATTKILGVGKPTVDGKSINFNVELDKFEWVQVTIPASFKGRIDMTKADLSALNKE